MMTRTHNRKHSKGQTDHVDAWLMSYADLITLLFMMFVIFVSVSVSKHSDPAPETSGELEYPYYEEQYPQPYRSAGTLALGTAFDDTYRTLVGIVLSNHADQYIAVEKTDHGIAIDISAVKFFAQGSAAIPLDQLPVLQSIVHVLKDTMRVGVAIEVAGHTSDEPLTNSVFSNNWELSAMRSARVVGMLVEQGADPSILRAVSYAGTQPLVPNKDITGQVIADNQKRNQRIVIKLESHINNKLLAAG